MKVVIDDCRLERMDVYTDPLNDKIKRQAAEITRLLAENEQLKKEKSVLSDCVDSYGIDIMQARAAGHEEAWELAQKIASMKTQEAADCFPEYNFPRSTNGLLNDYTYTEAAAKVAEWERKTEEICVGDVVLSNSTCEKCVVTANYNGIFTLLWNDGSSGNHGEKTVREYKKIGHIDVNAFLSQIGDEQK